MHDFVIVIWFHALHIIFVCKFHSCLSDTTNTYMSHHFMIVLVLLFSFLLNGQRARRVRMKNIDTTTYEMDGYSIRLNKQTTNIRWFVCRLILKIAGEESTEYTGVRCIQHSLSNITWLRIERNTTAGNDVGYTQYECMRYGKQASRSLITTLVVFRVSYW